MLPKKAISVISAAGQPFHDPAADTALFEAWKAGLKPGIPVIEMDCAINDAAFAEAVRAASEQRRWNRSDLAAQARMRRHAKAYAHRLTLIESEPLAAMEALPQRVLWGAVTLKVSGSLSGSVAVNVPVTTPVVVSVLVTVRVGAVGA